MFRKSIAILIAFVIIMQSLVNLGLCTYYSLNKKMIAEKLCVNKNKPQLHCNGHCFLAKQLNQAEQREKQQSQTLKEKSENVITDERSVLSLYFPAYRITAFYPQQISVSLWQYHSEIAKPPSA